VGGGGAGGGGVELGMSEGGVEVNNGWGGGVRSETDVQPRAYSPPPLRRRGLGRPSGPVLVVVEGDGPVALHGGHVGPVVAGARQQHVAQQRLDGRLAHQADEEQLLDDRRGHDAQGGQAEEQAAEAVGLAGVLVPHVLLQGALGLLLDALHVGDV